MKARLPAGKNHGFTSEVAAPPARRPSPLKADSEVAGPAQAAEIQGRPLPVVYMPLICLLVIVAAAYGLVVDDAYRLVSELTRQTWRAQDLVTLATVPVLLWATWQARKGSLSAHLVSVGILFWLTYGYAHLSFGAPFNAMFLVYLSVLTLAGFAMLDGLLRIDVAVVSRSFARVPRRATAWFLGIAGVGIAVLWLSEIIVAFPAGLPTNVHLSELPNPTWVLDLGWVIPTAIAVAVMLRRRHPAGPVIAAAMLVMLLILSVTMLTVVPLALAAGLGTDPVVRQQLVVFTIVFTMLGAIETWLLACAKRRFGPVDAPWLRRGWWPEAR
jgi:hypothetical protein